MSYRDYPLSHDTSQEAEDVLFKLLSKKSASEKLRMVASMNATVRMLAIGGLRERFPEDSDVDLRIRLTELLYGRDVALQIAKKLKKLRT